MATNKSFLYLNISQSYRNYAMPYMTPTYPENIRLLGPSSWEEMRNQQTDRQTTGFLPLTLTCTYLRYSFLCSILLHFVNILYPSLASLGLDKCNDFLTYGYTSFKLKIENKVPSVVISQLTVCLTLPVLLLFS